MELCFDVDAMSDKINGFNIDVVIESFVKCKEQNLSIDEYIRAYDEICHFFHLLGSIFGFITSDIVEKIEILRKFRSLEEPLRDKYESVDSMFNFEMERHKETQQALMGSRTLLRLHRALAFTSLFMERLGESSNADKASTIASNAYSETLAQFHPWLIRKAAQMAMYTLPSRGDMLLNVANNKTEAEVKELLKTCVLAIKPVYELTESLYTQCDLHGLP